VAAQHGIGERAVGQRVDAAYGLVGAVALAAQDVEVEGDGVLRSVGGDRPQLLDRQSVGEVQVVDRGQRGGAVGVARGVGA